MGLEYVKPDRRSLFCRRVTSHDGRPKQPVGHRDERRLGEAWVTKEKNSNKLPNTMLRSFCSSMASTVLNAAPNGVPPKLFWIEGPRATWVGYGVPRCRSSWGRRNARKASMLRLTSKHHCASHIVRKGGHITWRAAVLLWLALPFADKGLC